MGERDEGDIVTADSMTMTLRSAFRPEAARSFPATTYRVRTGEVDLAVTVDGAAVRIAHFSGDAAELEFEATDGIRSLMTGDATADAAIARGIVRITGGNPELLGRFAATFSLAPLAVPF
jgi:hypothetical protein